MCEKVYHLCAYCGAHRFAQWEECDSFWLRYAELIRHTNSRQGRPFPQECADRSATLRFLLPGTCPRLRTCTSLIDFTRARPRRALAWNASVGAVFGRHGAKRLARCTEEDKKQEREKEQERQEFADLWFQKRPLPRFAHCTAPVEQAQSAASASAKGRLDHELEREMERMRLTEEHQEAMKCLFDGTKDGTAPRSLGSTVIESGSEIESGDDAEDAASRARYKCVPGPRDVDARRP